ncbi:hypothetical protein [Thiohalorhabdus sp.]|uniref:hypothetical protein n=1 Tax=Thiohalorhabdus sp. TaxID=3094134 RepID=UPI002FC32951
MRLAIAFGGPMLEDPEVKRKVGSAEPKDMQLDPARDVRNLTTASFNLSWKPKAGEPGCLSAS